MNVVVPLEQFPGIDYFDQELVNLYNNAWRYVRDNWDTLPVDVQLLLHPYANGAFGPVVVHNPATAMAPFSDWVVYQWFNRTGDRPGLVQMMSQLQEERDAGRQPVSAMGHLARYIGECNTARYEEAFVHKGHFYKTRTKAQSYWSHAAGTLIGSAQDCAEFLLSESATTCQASALYRRFFAKEPDSGLRGREFFYLCKGFEKYGLITEVRTVVLKHLYKILDLPFQDYYEALICIVLMIENVIGLHVSEWRKQIDWLVPDIEEMSVSNLSIRGAPVSFVLKKQSVNWTVGIDCSKEYMLTVNAVGFPRKTFRSLYGCCVVPL